MSAHNERLTITTSKDFAKDLRRLVPRKQRSLFIEAAAAEKLKALKQKKALATAAGAWEDKDHPDIVKQGVDDWLRELRAGWDTRQGPPKHG